jgi:hypothetical protein
LESSTSWSASIFSGGSRPRRFLLVAILMPTRRIFRSEVLVQTFGRAARNERPGRSHADK